MCVCVVCVGTWSRAAVGALLLMAAHCSPLSVSPALSLSLCPGQFMGLPLLFQRTPQLNLCPWTQAFLRV